MKFQAGNRVKLTRGATGHREGATGTVVLVLIFSKSGHYRVLFDGDDTADVVLEDALRLIAPLEELARCADG